MQCNEKERESLLRFIRNKPELEAAFRYDQLAALSSAVSVLSDAVAEITQGVADGKLLPGKYRNVDKLTTQEHRTGLISDAAASLGRALAALDALAAVSGAYPRDFRHSAEFAYETRYDRLKALCFRFGYREGE